MNFPNIGWWYNTRELDNLSTFLSQNRKVFFWILIVDVIILGYVGANPPEGLYLLVGRVATIYYFVHFILIMPILGFKEKTIPLPVSISDPVLKNDSITNDNR